ncbi:MAG: tetratricopeptide repeat-containing sulfotransferase family protein, partial [Rhizomicrobium sp.]
LQQLGRWEGAARCFRKLLTRRPDHANAAACLALILAIKRDFAEAREWSTRVLARDRAHPIAAIALAMAEMDAEDFAGAEERLRDLLENPARTGEQGTAFAAGFAADAFDRHGCYREAFGVSRASKAMLRDLWSVQFEAKRMFDVARELAGYFSRAKPWSAAVHPAPSAEAPATHIFVLGFLRSGTTLIETILATNPQVVHADEIDFLNGAAHAFLIASAGLDRLAALDESEIAAWRETYWKAVRDAKFSVGGKIFVDKMPINTFRLPLIARLFPSAKIVFALRDPRDVVLGCFRRHFDPTYYSFEFLRLGDCARFYGATMALADVCREKLPLAILEHRYEDMVADFETSVRALCNFTGLAWSGAMRDFRQAAGAIDLRSASARQVRRGVYPDAVGHWRHYREQLAPVLPILAPWGARFGYPAE